MTTSIKTCFKCGAEKPLTEYYKHSQMADGYLNKCKECTKSDVRKNRDDNIDYYREYDNNRKHRTYTETTRKYRGKYPAKFRAHNKVNNGLRDGKIHRPDACESCGTQGIVHAHHDDYLKPLDIRWLCPICHYSWHQINGEGKNGEVDIKSE